jgi:hypothetical protein
MPAAISFEHYSIEEVKQGQFMQVPDEQDKELLIAAHTEQETIWTEEDIAAVSLVIVETAELAVNSTVDTDGNQLITISSLTSEESVLSILYSNGVVFISTSVLDIPELDEYEYIAVNTEHVIAEQIISVAVTGINDDRESCPYTPVFFADEALSEHVWGLIEDLLDTAVRDDDLSWLNDGYWEYEVTPLFLVYDFPALFRALTEAYKVTALLSDWARHQQHMLSYVLFDCDELKHRLIYYCVCEEISIDAVVEAYDWLWADENKEIRTEYLQLFTDQKILALNMLTNRGIVSQDFTRAMYHLITASHATSRGLTERIIEVMNEEWSMSLMEEIAEALGIDIDSVNFTDDYNEFG